jgi:hypothetical protein
MVRIFDHTAEQELLQGLSGSTTLARMRGWRAGDHVWTFVYLALHRVIELVVLRPAPMAPRRSSCSPFTTKWSCSGARSSTAVPASGSCLSLA